MTLRKRGRALALGLGRGFSGMASSHARHEQRLPGAACLEACLGACLGFRQRRASCGDHAPGTIERALAQLQAEQPIALERAR